MLQLDGHMPGLLQGVAAEEVGRAVILAQESPLAFLHHGGELAEVAYHEQLHTAERAVAVFVEAQHGINLVEEVGTYHGNLVNDEEVERADDVLLLLAEAVLLVLRIERASGDIGRQGELEERVYGDPTGIDGRHARRRHHDHALGRTLLETAQKGGLARTCLARKEYVHPRALHKLPREGQLLILLFLLHNPFFQLSAAKLIRKGRYFEKVFNNFGLSLTLH